MLETEKNSHKVAYEKFIINLSETNNCLKGLNEHTKLCPDIPVWSVVSSFFLPSALPSFMNNCEKIYAKKNANIGDTLKFSCASYLLRIFFLVNELAKARVLKKKKAKHTKTDILLISHINHKQPSGEVFRFQPLIEYFDKKKTSYDIIFADLLTNKGSTQVQNISTVYNYCTADMFVEAEKKSKQLAKEYQKQRKKLSKELEYNGMNVWGHIGPVFDLYYSKQYLKVLLLNYYAMKRLIELRKIKSVVITGTDSLTERCTLAAAKSAKIQTILIQHGFGGRAYAKKELELITKYLAFSEYEKKRTLAEKCDKSKVTVVGPLIFSQIVKYKKTATKKNRILLATSPFIQDNIMKKEPYFSALKKILSQITTLGFAVDIKLHPREKNIAEYQKIIKQFTECEIILHTNTTREEYYAMISRCNIFLNFGSSTMLEAMILDKPILTMNISNIKINFLMSSDTTRCITIDQDIKSAVLKTLEDKDKYKKIRRELVKKYLGTVDEKTTQRVASEILKTI